MALPEAQRGERRLSFALIAAVAVAATLGACSNPAPTATAAPESTPTPTADIQSTIDASVAKALTAIPTPTATATPTPTPTPSPTPSPTPAPTPTPPPTPTPRPLFQGKTILVLIGDSPGSDYDAIGRLLGGYISERIPDASGVVVTNSPEADGERALVRVMGSEPDGSTVTLVHPRFFKRELHGDDVPEFDLATAIVVGAPGAVSRNRVSSTYMMQERFGDYPLTWEGAFALATDRGQPLTRGGRAPGDSDAVASAFIQAIGGPVKMVYGYGSNASWIGNRLELRDAFDRGETDLGPCDRSSAPLIYPERVADMRSVPLWRIGPEDPHDDPEYIDWVEDELGRDIPPHLFDIVDATEGQRKVYDLVQAMNTQLAYAFVLPPGVPEDVVAVWRDAFKAVIEDPGFAERFASYGYEAQYSSPESIAATLEAGRQTLQDPSLLDLYTRMVSGEE